MRSLKVVLSHPCPYPLCQSVKPPRRNTRPPKDLKKKISQGRDSWSHLFPSTSASNYIITSLWATWSLCSSYKVSPRTSGKLCSVMHIIWVRNRRWVSFMQHEQSKFVCKVSVNVNLRESGTRQHLIAQICSDLHMPSTMCGTSVNVLTNNACHCSKLQI